MAPHTGRTGERGGPVMHQAITLATAAAPLPRRSDAGTVRVSGRDIDGLMLCGEMYGAPYDLLAACLNVQPDRLRGIMARGGPPDTPRPASSARTGVVPADPPRPGRPGPAVRAWTAVARTAGAPARGPGRPPGAGIQPRRASRPALVALRTPYPRRGRRTRRGRPHPRRRSLLGRDSRQPLPGATVGHRGRADPQAARPHRCHHGRAAVPPHRLQHRLRNHTTGPAMTAPSTSSPRRPAASSPAPPPRCPHPCRPGSPSSTCPPRRCCGDLLGLPALPPTPLGPARAMAGTAAGPSPPPS